MAQDVTEKNYLSIVAHYEDCLARHGDTHLGVDWPNREDALKRYRVMLQIMRPIAPAQKVTLPDFGCGASHLYEYILSCGLTQVEYAGLDLSEQFAQLAQSTFPANSQSSLDVLDAHAHPPKFDTSVM